MLRRLDHGRRRLAPPNDRDDPNCARPAPRCSYRGRRLLDHGEPRSPSVAPCTLALDGEREIEIHIRVRGSRSASTPRDLGWSTSKPRSPRGRCRGLLSPTGHRQSIDGGLVSPGPHGLKSGRGAQDRCCRPASAPRSATRRAAPPIDPARHRCCRLSGQVAER